MNATISTEHPVWKWSQPGKKFGVVFSFLSVLAVVIVTLEFMLARTGMDDPDIWWHLRDAEYLFQHHQLPRFDMYSFTVAGHPWINHEWLAEIPFYLAWQAWGLMGLKTLEILLLQLIFAGLLYLCWKESANFKAAFVACAFCSFLASASFGPRTILFGYACLVILLIILQRFRLRGNAPLWVIPLLFCLWINTHGSWLIGMICFSVIIVAGLVKGTWGRITAEPWTDAQRRQLVMTWLASVIALFINPFGFRLVLYPFDLAFRQTLNIAHIAEWVPVNLRDTHGRLAMVLVLALLLSALLRNRRLALSGLLLALFGLYCGLSYVRFLFLLAVLVSPLLAKILDFLPLYKPKLEVPWLNAFAILLMISAMFYYWPHSSALQGSIEKKYPVGALAFLKAHPPQGPVLNFYTWGGYMEWNDRDIPVFIDGRADIFEYAGVFQDYIDVLGDDHAKRTLDKYKIQYVLFPPDQAITYALEHDAGWRTLYRDEVGVLLERAHGGERDSSPASPLSR
jgi:hypothetical protein